jgi:elongator complex protein 3
MTPPNDPEKWLQARQYKPEQLAAARRVLEEVRRGQEVWQAMRRYPLEGGGYLPKHILVAVYRQLVASGEWDEDADLLSRIRMKPVRTLSGVTTVTVLTKPYACRGECIFCPNENNMPKSYVSEEPGARRGLQNDFDPFEQVCSRLTALTAVGHPTDKVELLILGGSFSYYTREYQAWFVRRCFDAMNSSESETLEAAQLANENAVHRNVGLVIETRPDEIDAQGLAWLRRLGVTKVQMGAQSLDDGILALNQRGHDVTATQRACAALRAGGFKIVLHWMPNLLGANLESDRQDFTRLWVEEAGGLGLCPDELKIYPCQLLASAPLYRVWQRGEYTPYTERQLIDLLADIKPGIPRYCRVNRVVRDIPSTYVVAGNLRTSLRMDVQEELARRGARCNCIRCREVRGQAVVPADLRLDDLVYRPAHAEEHFLSFVTPADQIAGYLRLSLPAAPERVEGQRPFVQPAQISAELDGAALIREVHVYGQSLQVGAEKAGAAQHTGLGTRLIAAAEEVARQAGYPRLAVIAAVGTRQYYRQRGFAMGELYMVKELEGNSP